MKTVCRKVKNGRDNGRGVVVESSSFYLFVSALEYHGEGAMTNQVFSVVLEVAYTLHLANFLFVNRLIENQLIQSNSISADTTSNDPMYTIVQG